jgi:hypothetical protein
MKLISIILSLISSCAYADLASVIKIPKGFKAEVYASVSGARQMAISDKGIIYVGSMDDGKVYAVDTSRKVHVVAENLISPQGVVWDKGSLYIAEIHQISKIDQIDTNFSKKPKLIAIKTFPSDRHHGWKTINIGPDGKL